MGPPIPKISGGGGRPLARALLTQAIALDSQKLGAGWERRGSLCPGLSNLLVRWSCGFTLYTSRDGELTTSWGPCFPVAAPVWLPEVCPRIWQHYATVLCAPRAPGSPVQARPPQGAHVSPFGQKGQPALRKCQGMSRSWPEARPRDTLSLYESLSLISRGEKQAVKGFPWQPPWATTCPHRSRRMGLTAGCWPQPQMARAVSCGVPPRHLRWGWRPGAGRANQMHLPCPLRERWGNGPEQGRHLLQLRKRVRGRTGTGTSERDTVY